jgi:hypothetical protein
VTLDVRKREIIERQSGVEEQKILNYIIEKSRRLMVEEALLPDLKRELEELTAQYEGAIKDSKDETLIDRYEDMLLGKMEEAEERLGRTFE